MKPKWRKFEDKIAKAFNSKRSKRSGGLWYNPGDSKSDQFLIENKQTEKKSYSVSLKAWSKLADESLFSYRLPILSLQIQDIELVVLDKNDFLRLLKKENKD